MLMYELVKVCKYLNERKKKKKNQPPRGARLVNVSNNDSSDDECQKYMWAGCRDYNLCWLPTNVMTVTPSFVTSRCFVDATALPSSRHRFGAVSCKLIDIVDLLVCFIILLMKLERK